MDGQIGEKRKNPVIENGVPAKRENLDLSSEIAKICPEVNSKLTLSPPSVTLPDKVRAVSSADSPVCKAPHAFDFRFVTSDDEVRQLLVAQTCDDHRDVTLISHPDDLSQANLVSRLSISDDGRHTLYPGKLFEGSQPFTLVLDIRNLSSEELPKFNDLLDPNNPCLYDKVSQEKRPLGAHVSLLVVADPEQLASVDKHNEASVAGAPGADFWRRINRPGNTWQSEPKTGNIPVKVPPLLTELSSAESAMDDDNTVLVDCHLHSNWRQLLMGAPGVNKQGRIRHIPGSLESLRAGQRVILKGADWQDLAFEQTLRQMLAQQSFESNGRICQLPDNVQFYQMPVADDELHSLFHRLSDSLEKQDDKEGDKELDKEQAPRTPIIINQSNIAQWLNPIAIAPEGYAVPNTCLLEQVRSGGVVTVTSPLTEALWLRLLGSLQRIRETTGLEPRLQLAHWKQQPKALRLTENDQHPLSSPKEKTGDHATFKFVTYQQHAQASRWINYHQPAPLVIQINEQTSFSELFDNIHITSEQKAYFGRRQSQLQEALTTGKPVVFRGLESNPTLQQLLEPLVVGQPLLVNGQLQVYPQARITLLWPESAKSPSSVFHSMIATGEPCPEVDLWEINAVRHEISRAELPEQALHSLYRAFATVPANLCNPLPEMTEGLLNNLILAARRAQQVDQSLQLLPRHWRKAIDSVITHGTRQNPSVRDFMKVACWHLLPDKTPDADEKPDEDHTASVDPDRLNAIINSALPLDRVFVEQNLWPLARAFDPAVFKGNELKLSYKSPFPEWGGADFFDRLSAIILAHVPEQQRDAIAYQLEISPAAAKPWQSLAIRPARQIKRLQDALACGWQLSLLSGQTRSDAIHALATDCFHRARTANSEAEGIERIEHRLAESLVWTGSADNPLPALARDLYHGSMNQKDRESRRLSRLHDRFSDSPVIFLQGETSTGKSYFSAKMAKASGQAAVISLGPSDSEQTLMKRWQWQQHADGDRSMAQQNRALMEWANTESNKEGEYITLVLDEANLAKAGLLASLNGLWEPEPCIYVNGHPVKVSAKHRVILTGNPDHYSGRQMDPALKEKLPRAYYPRLDQAFLRDRVVEPALANHLQRHLPEQQINDIAHSATNSVMALWQYYQELLPDHEFTPRDLTDICSWVGWYLDRALPARGSVTCGQINSLIQHSFRDVLGPEITETHQDALSALEIWFAARYQPENTLSDRVHEHTLRDMQQTFRTVTEKIRPDFDTSGSAVRELVQQLGQDLNRCQQAYHRKIKHGGRQATLIEGPAGRGKDATLNLVIESVKQQAEQRQELMPKVFYLNACDCSWDKLCEKIQTAKIKGGIVVISEMNLIDSQHLEGELNDILAGDAHPGFHLFATINPPEYSGRKPLSPALKGRFRHLPIRQYNPEELQTIVEKVLPQDPEGKIMAKRLTKQHCRLRAYLQDRKLPLQPTSLDLQNVARAVNKGGDFSDKALHQCLNQYYRLYLMAANISLELLLPSAPAMGRGAPDRELSEWFYQTVSSIDRPWLIRQSDCNSINEKRHEIRIDDLLDKEDAKTEVIKRLAQSRWQASGLSLDPNVSHDILNRVLYRHWQQCWFNREFGQSGVDANSVFPMTEEEEQTLKMSASQPCLQEADQQISQWNSDAVQLWPAFWLQISGQPSLWDEDSEQCIPQVRGKYSPKLDCETNYENLEKPKETDYKVFDTEEIPSDLYRCRVVDIDVTAEGNIKLIEINDRDRQRAETLTPDRLPGRGREVILASNQTLATLKQPSKNGQFALPSLTPDDCIMALRIYPDLSFTLVRGRYTGLHTLYVPEARAKQTIRVTYVVEPRVPDRKTSAKKARTERSIWRDNRCSEEMKKVLDGVFTTIDQQASEIQEPLRKIANAQGMTQRIQAITEYCQQFSGEAEPEKGKTNFFRFLVTQRQGSCRHRVPVFVALCRYFGIPCRQIKNFVHSFAEYSPDGGQTWESVNLSGAATESTEITYKFQPTRRVDDPGTVSRNIKRFLKDFLKGADSAQQRALAKACVMSLKKLKKALDAQSAWPEPNLSFSNLIRNLWERNDLTGFSMGVSMIESLGTNALSYFENPWGHTFTSKDWHIYKSMLETVKQLLSNSEEDQVTESLKSIHSKMIAQAGANPQQWLRLIVEILEDSDLTKPSIIHFAREAMESGWLDPLPTNKNHSSLPYALHELLVRLEKVDELKVEAAHCLKKWYQEFLSREKNSRAWQLFYKRLREKKEDTCHFFITHSHDGFSSLFANKIADLSLEVAWTDEPEGIPNIERMLVHNPAFAKLSSGKANHRPVIIMGKPFWCDTVVNKKAEALFQQKVENSRVWQPLLEKINRYKAIEEERRLNSEQLHAEHEKMLRELPVPRESEECEKRRDEVRLEVKRKRNDIYVRYKAAMESLEMSTGEQTLVDNLKDKCVRAIQQAFSHYLYGLTHSKGGSLTYCWTDAFVWDEGYRGNYGAHDPSSPEELYTMMSETDNGKWSEKTIKDANLRQAHNASNALVLKSDELTKIAEEFLNSVNLNSLCNALDT
ncbi:AAA family ATPase [Endozoicomonas sp. 8E]|uniref:AAA family ATPase n=1 Tax=Endozoicomonas sp. 8E TaxID=3035692 RepID=UPI002939514F|nr:AAA family ATPase [Endozoicomonas sp. 8E]WOG28863.1 AAA family ATPase [Endozoicomonas sp. 8E]